MRRAQEDSGIGGLAIHRVCQRGGEYDTYVQGAQRESRYYCKYCIIGSPTEQRLHDDLGPCGAGKPSSQATYYTDAMHNIQ